MSQLVVLCGGFGTRMAAVTGTGQKCLVPVAGRPFLAHVLDRAARPPVDRVLLLAGHRADQVRQFAERWRRPGPEATGPTVTVLAEAAPAGPVAALRSALDQLDQEFLLALGDVLPPDADGLWHGLARTLRTTGARAVMGTARQEHSLDQGNVRVEGGWVTSYHKDRPAPRIDRGIRFLTRDAVRDHSGDADGPFFGALAARRQLADWSYEEPIVEVGTPERWRAACAVLAAGPFAPAPGSAAEAVGAERHPPSVAERPPGRRP